MVLVNRLTTLMWMRQKQKGVKHRREREARRLENEQKQREHEERLRVAKEKEEEEKRRREQLKEQRQKEIEEEEARRQAEEQKLLELEAELCRRRDQLFNYKFGDKTRLDNFMGLSIDDVTQLRIGVFGPTGSGKSCFINTCERAVRQTEKGSLRTAQQDKREPSHFRTTCQRCSSAW